MSNQSIEELAKELKKSKGANREVLKELRARLRKVAIATRVHVSVPIKGRKDLNLLVCNYWNESSKRQGGSKSVSVWGIRVGPFPASNLVDTTAGEQNYYYTLSEPRLMGDEELMLDIVATLPTFIKRWSTAVSQKRVQFEKAKRAVEVATNQLLEMSIVHR